MVSRRTGERKFPIFTELAALVGGGSSMTSQSCRCAPGPSRLASRLGRRAVTAVVSLTALLGALFVTAASPTGATVAAGASSAGGQGAAASQATPVLGGDLRTAYYFGNADPLDFWSSNLSGAEKAFELMARNGFNSVGLVVPWGEFQTKLIPPTNNPVAFERLNHLVALAASLRLKVVLRLSYLYDVDPADQLPWGRRQAEVYTSSRVYKAWLAYISSLHSDLAKFHNVRLVYFSWEDWFTPVTDTFDATTASQRLALAKQFDYQRWLSRHYSLQAVDFYYGEYFGSWSQVPVPTPQSPALLLMYAFDDWMLINRFFHPAQHYFPGLTLETRTVTDTIVNGSEPVTGYTHPGQYTLSGTSITGMFFSPYMADPSTSPIETAAEGLQSLDSVLATVHSWSPGRKVYIQELEFVSNAPQVVTNPQLGPDQVGPFLIGSASELAHETIGYGLWTYRNQPFSPVYNPNFALGPSGWEVRGAVTAKSSAYGTSWLQLAQHSSLSQLIPASRMITYSGDVDVAVVAQGVRPGSFTVSLAGHTQRVDTSTRIHRYEVSFPPSDLGKGRLTITAGRAVKLYGVQMYGYTQTGDVYNAQGKPELALQPLRELNEELASETS